MPESNLENQIPELGHNNSSWVVISKETGKAVAEIFTHKVAERINFEKYRLITIADYLPSLNKRRIT